MQEMVYQPQPTHPGYGSQAYAQATPSVRGVGGVLVGLLAARAAFPVVTWVFFRAIGRVDSPVVGHVVTGIEGLLALSAVITFLVWIHRVVRGLRARAEPTRFSPGMSVGGWFIPFANFVLPCMSLSDVWRRVMRTSAAPVVFWWILYLLSAVFDAGMRAMPVNDMPIDTVRIVYTTAFYVGMLIEIGAWGLWLYIVRSVTQRQPA